MINYNLLIFINYKIEKKFIRKRFLEFDEFRKFFGDINFKKKVDWMKLGISSSHIFSFMILAKKSIFS